MGGVLINNKELYYDYAATTPVYKTVQDVMNLYQKKYYGNPSSNYTLGIKNKNALLNARSEIAEYIHAKPEEIIFTSGGSEADSLAILGTVFAHGSGHIITSQIEHKAILKACRFVEDKMNIRVTYLPVNKQGYINPDDVELAIQEDTILISIMAENNETGVIQPVQQIGHIAKKHNIYFHTDAVQWCKDKIPFSINDYCIDMMSVSGHKFGAPKGIGFLYVKNGTKLSPIIFGGSQEYGLRGGTENIAAIVGLSEALRVTARHNYYERTQIHEKKEFGSYFSETLTKQFKEKHILDLLFFNSITSKIINFGIKGIDNSTMVACLDDMNIYCSRGSACNAGSTEPSHVLTAMGIDKSLINNSLRFSFNRSYSNNEQDYKDIEYVVNAIIEIVLYLKQYKNREEK